MRAYKVELECSYGDTVHVLADTPEEAIKKAEAMGYNRAIDEIANCVGHIGKVYDPTPDERAEIIDEGGN